VPQKSRLPYFALQEILGCHGRGVGGGGGGGGGKRKKVWNFRDPCYKKARIHKASPENGREC